MLGIAKFTLKSDDFCTRNNHHYCKNQEQQNDDYPEKPIPVGRFF